MERGKGLMDINLDTVLAPYHPNSANEFKTEFDCCVRYLSVYNIYLNCELLYECNAQAGF